MQEEEELEEIQLPAEISQKYPSVSSPSRQVPRPSHSQKIVTDPSFFYKSNHFSQPSINHTKIPELPKKMQNFPVFHEFVKNNFEISDNQTVSSSISIVQSLSSSSQNEVGDPSLNLGEFDESSRRILSFGEDSNFDENCSQKEKSYSRVSEIDKGGIGGTGVGAEEVFIASNSKKGKLGKNGRINKSFECSSISKGSKEQDDCSFRTLPSDMDIDETEEKNESFSFNPSRYQSSLKKINLSLGFLSSSDEPLEKTGKVSSGPKEISVSSELSRNLSEYSNLTPSFLASSNKMQSIERNDSKFSNPTNISIPIKNSATSFESTKTHNSNKSSLNSSSITSCNRSNHTQSFSNDLNDSCSLEKTEIKKSAQNKIENFNKILGFDIYPPIEFYKGEEYAKDKAGNISGISRTTDLNNANRTKKSRVLINEDKNAVNSWYFPKTYRKFETFETHKICIENFLNTTVSNIVIMKKSEYSSISNSELCLVMVDCNKDKVVLSVEDSKVYFNKGDKAAIGKGKFFRITNHCDRVVEIFTFSNRFCS